MGSMGEEQLSGNGMMGGIPEAEDMCKLYIGQAMVKEYAM